MLSLAPACVRLREEGTAYAQTPSAVSTADRHHAFVEHAESRYRQYLTSESRGDTAAYKEARTRQAYELTIEQLKKLGKAESALGPMLQRVASLRPDVSQLRFVRCDAKTRVARLLSRPWDGVAQFESTAWKVNNEA